MLSSTFWTEPHFTGITLILGCLLFGGGYLYWLIKDEKGSNDDNSNWKIRTMVEKSCFPVMNAGEHIVLAPP